jgi:AcrR family transcriptional regulator
VPAATTSTSTDTTEPRSLAGDKAQRIVDAMRSSVAKRGVAGSTFDHVAREAGVSRGLLHYYFGTKERLLTEVVRHDCNLRMALLDQQLRGAQTADDFIGLLAAWMKNMVDVTPDFIVVVFEMFTLAQRNEDISREYVELMRQPRETIARVLANKQDEGVLKVHGDPEGVADVLLAMGDGLGLRLIGEPDRDHETTMQAALHAAKSLLSDA